MAMNDPLQLREQVGSCHGTGAPCSTQGCDFHSVTGDSGEEDGGEGRGGEHLQGQEEEDDTLRPSNTHGEQALSMDMLPAVRAFLLQVSDKSILNAVLFPI